MVDDARQQERMCRASGEPGIAGGGRDDALLFEPRQELRPIHAAWVTEVGRVAIGHVLNLAAVIGDLAREQRPIERRAMTMSVELDLDVTGGGFANFLG